MYLISAKYITFSGTSGVEPTFICKWGEPHTVILHRGQKGFGFVLRGAKADSPLMELQPSERFPALQYLDDVDENGVADRAGLRKGDFILAVRLSTQSDARKYINALNKM